MARVYNCRQTSISTLLAAGAKPLFVCHQTGTSLEMHYGDARVDAHHLDQVIADVDGSTRNLPEPPKSSATTLCRR